MPELPDLEVFAHNLSRKLKGKKLNRLHISRNAKLSTTEAELRRSVQGKVLSAVYREGKELRFAFEDKTILGIHLMLRGKFFWYGDKNTQNHTLMELSFAGGPNLALTDYQSNARVTLNPEETGVPDALSEEVNENFLQTILDSRATVKKILLDQHRIRGIGNAYADEILWDARISPFSIGNKIPPPAIKALQQSIKKVLEEAVHHIKKAEADIIGGEVRDFLLIHNASKSKSPSGGEIKKEMAGGRPTYFTAEQHLYK